VTASSLSFVAGLRDIADRYPALLCDVWGVLHDGAEPSPGAAEALRRYRAGGGRVVLLTNAPRPAAAVGQQLVDLYGYTDDCWDAIVTSGEAFEAMIAARGRVRVYNVGPARHFGLYDGTAVELVPAEAAEWIVATGLFDDEVETPEDYRAGFAALVARGLPMLCANPDIVVKRGGELVYCAGALARLYAELGGAVTYVGKPHRPIYDAVRARLRDLTGRDLAGRDILAVGDGLPTDVAGARAEGFDLLFVTNGIHAAEFGGEDAPDPAKVAARLVQAGVDLDRASAVIRLVW
jgi:HAD superfamily hydrolase (TIGR01459 family)